MIQNINVNYKIIFFSSVTFFLEVAIDETGDMFSRRCVERDARVQTKDSATF
jgi:hypothetical protein